MIMIRMIIIQILVATKMRIEFESLEYYVSKLKPATLIFQIMI